MHCKVVVSTLQCMGPVVEPTSQWLRGVLDLCLLAALSREALYGYEMTRRLAEAGLDAVAEGSIYPALARLERADLVEAVTRSGSGGPPRKYYSLTATGRRTLMQRSADWREFAASVELVLAGQAEGEGRG